jgi:hypothetical protein
LDFLKEKDIVETGLTKMSLFHFERCIGLEGMKLKLVLQSSQMGKGKDRDYAACGTASSPI